MSRCTVSRIPAPCRLPTIGLDREPHDVADEVRVHRRPPCTRPATPCRHTTGHNARRRTRPPRRAPSRRPRWSCGSEASWYRRDPTEVVRDATALASRTTRNDRRTARPANDRNNGRETRRPTDVVHTNRPSALRRRMDGPTRRRAARTRRTRRPPRGQIQCGAGAHGRIQPARRTPTDPPRRNELGPTHAPARTDRSWRRAAHGRTKAPARTERPWRRAARGRTNAPAGSRRPTHRDAIHTERPTAT